MCVCVCVCVCVYSGAVFSCFAKTAAICAVPVRMELVSSAGSGIQISLRVDAGLTCLKMKI